MKASGLFGDRAPGVISVVEPSVSRWYAHRARVAFWVSGVVAGVLAVAVLRVAGLPSGLAPVFSLVVAVLLSAVAGAVVGFVVALLVRLWPVLRVVWWWLPEIAVVALLVVLSVGLAGVSAWLPVLVPAGLAAVLGLVPGVRRRVVAWSWCVIVRHRLRLCFAEFIRSTERAKPAAFPLLLWARPTPAGERVWVWLRPGLDLSNLDGKTGRMAVACWAGEVRVVRASARFAALLRIDVTRRDPLTGLVVSPLSRFGSGGELLVPVSPGVAPVGLDLDQVPEPPPEQPRQRGR